MSELFFFIIGFIAASLLHKGRRDVLYNAMISHNAFLNQELDRKQKENIWMTRKLAGMPEKKQ